MAKEKAKEEEEERRRKKKKEEERRRKKKKEEERRGPHTVGALTMQRGEPTQLCESGLRIIIAEGEFAEDSRTHIPM
jgi:hypothetical protein